MKYKNKNDINYLQFLQFSKEIEGKEDDDSFVAYAIMAIFKPDTVEEFRDALMSTDEVVLKHKFELNFKKAYEFIDADTFINDNDTLAFLDMVIKPKYFWQKKSLEKLSYAEAEYIINLFFYLHEKRKRDIHTFITRHLQPIMEI